MQRAQSQTQNRITQKFEALGGKLNAVSPLATLDRGFAIARDKQQLIIRSTGGISENDPVTIQLSEGSLDCKVEKVR